MGISALFEGDRVSSSLSSSTHGFGLVPFRKPPRLVSPAQDSVSLRDGQQCESDLDHVRGVISVTLLLEVASATLDVATKKDGVEVVADSQGGAPMALPDVLSPREGIVKLTGG